MKKLRNVVSKAQEKGMAEQENRVLKEVLPHEYGCQILLEKTTLQAAKDKNFPNDARLIWYKVDQQIFIDLTRCTKTVDLFDMYYDKYGPGSVQKIDFGYGRVNPKLWGNDKGEKKSKK